MYVIVTCKYKKDPIKKQPRKRDDALFPIITLWELFVAMETRVLIWSAPKCSLFPTPMMLQIKFDCNRPAGLGDSHVWKCGRTDARTPARVPSYKLTLWAFGSGELKTPEVTYKPWCRFFFRTGAGQTVRSTNSHYNVFLSISQPYFWWHMAHRPSVRLQFMIWQPVYYSLNDLFGKSRTSLKQEVVFC